MKPGLGTVTAQLKYVSPAYAGQLIDEIHRLRRAGQEGMKRTLVLAPKLQIDVSRPERVFAHLVASIAPPPEMEQPPLWSDPDSAIETLAAIPWPPHTEGGAA